LIGCTILRAVSGILRTQRGRRGSGSGRQPAGALRLLYSLLWLNPRPRGSTLRPSGSTLAPVAQRTLLSPQWLSSSPQRLNSLSLGWIAAAIQWPWAFVLRRSPACQIKPDRFAIVVVIGVQWGRFGLARFAGGCRRVVYSLSSGWRRHLATSPWPWAFVLRRSPACQIKPDRFAIVVVIGVQWGRFGLARFAGGCRRVVNSEGLVPVAPAFARA
jgi:hypothetical protein